MAFGSFLHRSVSLAAIAGLLLGCSTDSLMPSASIDTSSRVGAIGPLELEGRVGSKQLGYPAPAAPVASAALVPVDPDPNALVSEVPKKKLPMIDSDEAAGIDTSMGVQPLRAPDASNGVPVQIASAAPSASTNIAESGTSEPVVDGIGTDSPQLLASPARQASKSAIPITWSDKPSIGDDGDQVADPLSEPQPEQKLAFLPKLKNPMSVPADSGQEPDATPAPMSASDIQCRRDLQALGVQFHDMPTISQGPTCGIAHPVSVSGFDGGRIRLSPTATLNCPVTLQFAKWIHNELVPSARLRYWSGVKSIRQMSAYSCRRMNSDPNNPWSEHAKGNAIDIGTITLNNGHVIDVEKKGLFSFNEGALLNAVRSDSCKYFDTVLGPGSNRYHKDHFHFDLRERRGGRKYCN